jgi:predicted outer membrane protein
VLTTFFPIGGNMSRIQEPQMQERRWGSIGYRCIFLGGLFVATSSLLLAQEPVYVTIPVGTQIPVITLDELSSKTAKKGDKLNLSVDGDVVIAGRTVIEKGAPIWGSVAQVKKAGRFGNDGSLAIKIDSVRMVDGKTVSLLADLTDTTKAAPEKKGSGRGGKPAVSGIPGADVATGFFDKGDDVTFEPNAQLRVYTAAYTYVQFLDTASTQQTKSNVSDDSSGTEGSSDDSAAVTNDSSNTTADEGAADDAAGIEPALLLLDGIETWGRALGAFAAHLGSTPQVRALGARMEKDHAALQAQAAALAAEKKITLLPLVPGDQAKLNETLQTLRDLKPEDFDQNIAQRIYALGENVLGALDGASPAMEALVIKTVEAWKEHMAQAAKLMTTKPAKR